MSTTALLRGFCVDWQRERFVKLYTRNTANWVALGYHAQSLLMHLIREVDRNGELSLGNHGHRSVALVLHAVDLWESEISPALDKLIQGGQVEIDGDTLRLPKFVEAQEAITAPALRQKAYRERQREASLLGVGMTSLLGVTERDGALRGVTERDGALRGVTQGDAALPTVTTRLEETRRDLGTTYLVGFAPDGAGVVGPDSGTEPNATPHEVPQLELTSPATSELSKPKSPGPTEIAERWVAWFNRRFDRRYRVGKELVGNVSTLLRAGYSLDDMRLVAAWARDQWQAKPEMADYLRPSTILRPGNFKRYVLEAREQLEREGGTDGAV